LPVGEGLPEVEADTGAAGTALWGRGGWGEAEVDWPVVGWSRSSNATLVEKGLEAWGEIETIDAAGTIGPMEGEGVASGMEEAEGIPQPLPAGMQGRRAQTVGVGGLVVSGGRKAGTTPVHDRVLHKVEVSNQEGLA